MPWTSTRIAPVLDVPGQMLRTGPRNLGTKNKHFGADGHDPKARTSMTQGGFKKLRSEKPWAEFSFPKSGQKRVQKVLWWMWTSQSMLHWCKRGLHWCKSVQQWCKRLLWDHPFSRMTETPFAPFPNYFGQFWGFGPLYQALGAAKREFVISWTTYPKDPPVLKSYGE